MDERDTELVVDPSEVFPDLMVEDPGPGSREGTPDPVVDAGGEEGELLNELPDPPLDDLVLDNQAYQNALQQTAFNQDPPALLNMAEATNGGRISTASPASVRGRTSQMVTPNPLQVLG